MSVTPYIEFNNKAMEFNNKAMEKLWIYLNNQYMFISDTDVANAFIKCDEELTDIQDQCEHWKTMYGNACGDQDVLKESIRLLDTENRRLRQQVSDQEKEYKSLQGLNLDIITKHNEDMRQLREENEELKKECEDLRKNNEALGRVIKRNIDITTVNRKTIYQLRKDNEALASAVNSKDDELQGLQKENEELNKDCAYMTNSRDTWRSRAKHAEARVEELEKLKTTLEYGLYADLRKDYNKLFEENKILKTGLAEANDILEKTNRDRNEWRRRALMTKLTSKVPDIKEEYTMTFTMDEADYKEIMKLLLNKAYGASPEHMRDFLKEFCDKRYFCNGCPLRDCDCDFDTISDEEIEEYYKMAISSGAHEKIKDSPDVKDDEKRGMYKLWDMLQHVSDYYYFGVDDQFNNDDCDATSMEDIIDIHDLDSFIESYEKWDKR